VLPTREPPSSFIAKKQTGSVTFDGAIALQQTEQFAGGLAIAYGRNGAAGAALRIYKDDQEIWALPLMSAVE
jgi:hypothetical protein